MPGGYKNIRHEDGAGFDKNPENINRNGAPKKIYTILKENGYCKSDIVTAFNELAWYTMPEIKNLLSDDSKPVIVHIIANQLKTALEKGEWSRIKEIIEMVIGRPTQAISVDTTKVNIDPIQWVGAKKWIGE